MRLHIHQVEVVVPPVVYEGLTELEVLEILEAWSKKNYMRISEVKDGHVYAEALSVATIPEYDSFA